MKLPLKKGHREVKRTSIVFFFKSACPLVCLIEALLINNSWLFIEGAVAYSQVSIVRGSHNFDDEKNSRE